MKEMTPERLEADMQARTLLRNIQNESNSINERGGLILDFVLSRRAEAELPIDLVALGCVLDLLHQAEQKLLRLSIFVEDEAEP